MKFVVLSSLVCFLSHGDPASAETWTGLRGNHQVDADLLGLWEDNAVLKLKDGRRVSVPLSNLISESRIHAKKVAQTLEEQRTNLVQELKAQAAEEMAPAPLKPDVPPPAPEYSAIAKDKDVLDALQHLQDQSRDGHALLAYYDSLPPKFRSEFASVIKSGADKSDKASYDATIGPYFSFADLILTRQKWIFNHPRMRLLEPQTLERLQSLTLNVAGVVRETFYPDAFSGEKFGSMPLRDWLVERDKAVSPYLYALQQEFQTQSPSFELIDDAASDGPGDGSESGSSESTESSSSETSSSESSSSSEVDSSSAPSGEAAPGAAAANEEANTKRPEPDEVKVRVRYDETHFSIIEMKKVDGFWIPKATVDDWEKTMASAKEKVGRNGVAGLFDDPVVSSLGSFLQPMTERLAAAENRESFHRELESVFQQTGTIMSMFSGLISSASQLNDFQKSSSSDDSNASGHSSDSSGI